MSEKGQTEEKDLYIITYTDLCAVHVKLLKPAIVLVACIKN